MRGKPTKFSKLPGLLDFRLSFVQYLLVFLSTAFFFYLFLSRGEWGDKATIVQAFSSIIIIIATYESIKRSDRQIDILIAQERGHYLDVILVDNSSIVISNLSRMPIALTEVFEFNSSLEGDELTHYKKYPSQKPLGSGESTVLETQLFLGEEIKKRLSHYVFEGAQANELHPLSRHGVVIRYRYGGTGSTLYEKTYKFMHDIDINEALLRDIDITVTMELVSFEYINMRFSPTSPQRSSRYGEYPSIVNPELASEEGKHE